MLDYVIVILSDFMARKGNSSYFSDQAPVVLRHEELVGGRLWAGEGHPAGDGVPVAGVEVAALGASLLGLAGGHETRHQHVEAQRELEPAIWRYVFPHFPSLVSY